MSWMLGRHLSRSDLMTSLRCGWLLVMAVKTLQQQNTDINDWKYRSPQTICSNISATHHLYIHNIRMDSLIIKNLDYKMYV